MPTLHFRIQLDGITKPPVWRKLAVPDHLSFLDFHEVIQAAFGWTNTHLFQFSEKGYGCYPIYGSADLNDGFYEADEFVDAGTAALSTVFTGEGRKFVHIYDFGDNWHHLITLEKISEETAQKPGLTAGEGACPPEDCGGVPGYEQLKETLKDPSDPEYEGLREWLGLEEGEEWDPAAFDLEEAQQAVDQAF